MVLTYFVGSPDFDRFELFVGGRCALFVSLFLGKFPGLGRFGFVREVCGG